MKVSPTSTYIAEIDASGFVVHLVRSITASPLRSHAVGLEVIKIRTNVPSESAQTREEFRIKLLERDTSCVWTGAAPRLGVGLHIIPYKQGSEVSSIFLCKEDV
jgi:hypothetical protein